MFLFLMMTQEKSDQGGTNPEVTAWMDGMGSGQPSRVPSVNGEGTSVSDNLLSQPQTPVQDVSVTTADYPHFNPALVPPAVQAIIRRQQRRIQELEQKLLI